MDVHCRFLHLYLLYCHLFFLSFIWIYLNQFGPYLTHDLLRQMSGGTPDLSNPNVAAAMAVLQKKMPGMMGGASGGTGASAATEEEDIPEFNANEGDDVD